MTIDPEEVGRIGGDPDGRGILIEMVSISGVTEVVLCVCMHACICLCPSVFCPPMHILTRVVVCMYVCSMHV